MWSEVQTILSVLRSATQSSEKDLHRRKLQYVVQETSSVYGISNNTSRRLPIGLTKACRTIASDKGLEISRLSGWDPS